VWSYPKLKRLTDTVTFWDKRDDLLEALA
jgi:hypothetical protein